ncbi:MAG: hypothetical protein INQ03_22635 [Candidatus Heimdallarchaeota archaeon]|nr:hypothetical protein [Candidatus Heimdallarchaeota archaeon]
MPNYDGYNNTVRTASEGIKIENIDPTVDLKHQMRSDVKRVDNSLEKKLFGIAALVLLLYYLIFT